MKKMNDYEKSVKSALTLEDMSMAELAGELGIGKPYLYDIISGARTAMKVRERINTMLGIEDDYDNLTPIVPIFEDLTLEELAVELGLSKMYLYDMISSAQEKRACQYAISYSR